MRVLPEAGGAGRFSALSFAAEKGGKNITAGCRAKGGAGRARKEALGCKIGEVCIQYKRMRLFAEMLRQLGAEEDVCTSRVQYAVIDGRGGYFQNVKEIREFSDTAIVFRGGKGGVRVEGERLALGKYFGGDATVLGDISRVERCEC